MIRALVLFASQALAEGPVPAFADTCKVSEQCGVEPSSTCNASVRASDGVSSRADCDALAAGGWTYMCKTPGRYQWTEVYCMHPAAPAVEEQAGWCGSTAGGGAFAVLLAAGWMAGRRGRS